MLLDNDRDRLYKVFCNAFGGRICPEEMGHYLWTCEDYEYEDELAGILGDVVSEIDYGASKLVLKVQTENNWVFKLPFYGEYYYDYDTDKGEYTDKKHYSVFSNITRGLNWDIIENNLVISEDRADWDYCYVESLVSEFTEKYHSELSDMFAKTYCVGYYGKIPVYASERCDKNWSCEYTKFEDSAEYKKVKDIYIGRISDLTFSQQVAFVVDYGLTAANKLFDFISEIGIFDLHGANIAFDNSNKIHLIDYSGYCCF